MIMMAIQVTHNNVKNIMELPCIEMCRKMENGKYRYFAVMDGIWLYADEGDWIVEDCGKWKAYTDKEWKESRTVCLTT